MTFDDVLMTFAVMKATQPKRKAKKKKWPKIVMEGNASVRVYCIKRANGYPLFQVANHSTGKRKLEGFSDEIDALKRAGELAKLIQAGDVAGADLSGREAASYGRAIELIRPTGDRLETVADRYASAVEILGDGARLIEAARYFAKRNPDSLPKKTVEEVVEDLLATMEADASKRYLQDLRSRLGIFAKSFQTYIGSITTSDIQLWLDGLKAHGKKSASAQTRKNFQTVVNRLFTFAKARGYVVENPVESSEAVKVKNGAKVTIYTSAEINALIRGASKDFLPCIVIGAFCGLRSAEIMRLPWSAVDLADGQLTVAAGDAKTASRRIVPIPDNARQWLAPYVKMDGLIWTGSPEDFYDTQQATVKAAQQVEDGLAADGKRKPLKLRWKANALRHSFCSYRLAVVKNAGQVALEAGNSAGVIFKHYREIVKEKDAAAYFNVSPDQPTNLVSIKTA